MNDQLSPMWSPTPAPAEAAPSCNQSIELSTPYNDDERIPSYVGLMFQVFAKSSLDIITLEFEVRQLPPLTNETTTDGYSVEVYTSLEKFDKINGNSSAWTLVANTQGLLVPGSNNMVIPPKDFLPLSMAAGEMRSLYVTMKGPYLDSTAYALHKTGEFYMGDENLNIMVGAGLTAYKFPNDRDHTIDPQFAGVIHYQQRVDCSQALTQTMVHYSYLIQGGASISNAAVANFIQEAADVVLQQNPALAYYQGQYQLQRVGAATTATSSYHGPCPNTWTTCPTSIFNTTISLVHLVSLDPDVVRYEFLRSRSNVDRVLQQNLGGKESIFTGQDAVSATFSLTLNRVPLSEPMDDAQSHYLADELKSFFNHELTGSYSTVMGVQIEATTTSATTNRLRNLQATSGNGAVQVNGKIFAIQPVGLSSTGFLDSVESSLRNAQSELISSLQTHGKMLSSISDKDLHYFSHVKWLTSKLTADQLPAPTVRTGVQNDTVTDNHMARVGAVAVVLGLVVICVLLARKRWKMRRSYLEDLKKYRELMRLQRRERREAKESRKSGQKHNRSSSPTPTLDPSEMELEVIDIDLDDIFEPGSQAQKKMQREYGAEVLRTSTTPYGPIEAPLAGFSKTFYKPVAQYSSDAPWKVKPFGETKLPTTADSAQKNAEKCALVKNGRAAFSAEKALDSRSDPSTKNVLEATRRDGFLRNNTSIVPPRSAFSGACTPKTANTQDIARSTPPVDAKYFGEAKPSCPSQSRPGARKDDTINTAKTKRPVAIGASDIGKQPRSERPNVADKPGVASMAQSANDGRQGRVPHNPL